MTENERQEAWARREIRGLQARGERCVLWGIPATSMSREELLGFIGFLDETWSNRYAIFRGHVRMELRAVAPWWKFWNPMSGLLGGLLFGAVLALALYAAELVLA